MNILLIGATGLLGLNLINKLKFDKLFLNIHKKNYPVVDKKNIYKVSLDFSDDSFRIFLRNNNIDFIYHAGGMTNVEKCEINKKKCLEINYTLVKKIVDVLIEFPQIKLIYFSTDHLFSGSQKFYSEESKPNPLNNYALSKCLAERVIKKKLVNFLIIRTNFFGWGPTYRKSFSDFIFYNLLKNNDIFLYKNVYFTPILIESLINIVLKLIDLKQSGIFNIASNDRVSKFEFGVLLANYFSLDVKLINSISYIPKTTIRPLDMSLSISKIESLNLTTSSVKDEIKKLKNQFNRTYYKDIINL